MKPPAALLRFDDDQERRVKEAEDLAAQRTSKRTCCSYCVGCSMLGLFMRVFSCIYT